MAEVRQPARLLRASCGAIRARSCCSWGRSSRQGAEWNDQQGLDWHLLDVGRHEGVQSLVTDLNRAYRELPALHQRDCDGSGFAWLVADDAENSVFAWLRHGERGEPPVLVVVNFTPVPRDGYRIGRCRSRAAGSSGSTPTPRCMAARASAISVASRRRHCPGTASPARPPLTLPPLATLSSWPKAEPRFGSSGRSEMATTMHRPGALSRNAMAYVLAGGRGSRLYGADRPPRQARGLFRRQDADHRFRALQRAQFRHPPHRRGDPVQGAQPDPPSAARLELPPPRAQRELRHPAG